MVFEEIKFKVKDFLEECEWSSNFSRHLKQVDEEAKKHNEKIIQSKKRLLTKEKKK